MSIRFNFGSSNARLDACYSLIDQDANEGGKGGEGGEGVEGGKGVETELNALIARFNDNSGLMKSLLRNGVEFGVDGFEAVVQLAASVRARVSALMPGFNSDARKSRYNSAAQLLDDDFANYQLLRKLSHTLLGSDGDRLNFSDQLFRLVSDCVNADVPFEKLYNWINSVLDVVVRRAFENYFLNKNKSSRGFRGVRMKMLSFLSSLRRGLANDDVSEEIDGALNLAIENYDASSHTVAGFLQHLEEKYPQVDVMNYVLDNYFNLDFEELLRGALFKRLQATYAKEVVKNVSEDAVTRFVRLMVGSCLDDQGVIVTRKIVNLYHFCIKRFAKNSSDMEAYKRNNDRLDEVTVKGCFVAGIRSIVRDFDADAVLPRDQFQLNTDTMFANPEYGVKDYAALGRRFENGAEAEAEAEAVIDEVAKSFGCEGKEGLSVYLRTLYNFLKNDFQGMVLALNDGKGYLRDLMTEELEIPEVGEDGDLVNLYFGWVKAAGKDGENGFVKRRMVLLLQLAHLMKKAILVGDVATAKKQSVQNAVADFLKIVDLEVGDRDETKVGEVLVKSQSSLMIKLLRGGHLVGIADFFRMMIVVKDDTALDLLVKKFNEKTAGKPVVEHIKDKRGKEKANQNSAEAYEDVTFIVRVEVDGQHVPVEIKCITKDCNNMANDFGDPAYHGRYEVNRLKGVLEKMFPYCLYPGFYFEKEDGFGGRKMVFKFGSGADWSCEMETELS